MTWELSEGMYLNIVVIITYFFLSVMLSLLINDFVLYIAVVKCVLLIVVNALYKSPLLLLYYYNFDNKITRIVGQNMSFFCLYDCFKTVTISAELHASFFFFLFFLA